MVTSRTDQMGDCRLITGYSDLSLRILGPLSRICRAAYPLLQDVVYPVYDAQGCLTKTIAIDVDATRVSRALEEKQAHIATLEHDLNRLTRIDTTMESSGNDSLPVPLTGRELQVLRFMARGATNREISELLRISHHTVKSHVIHIFNKLGVDDRTEASVWAARHSLI
jgi:DNA-binding NarL/FixJ family response regulator